MNIDQLISLWDADCAIDDSKLDRESLSSPKLHVKYLRYFVEAKIKHAALTSEANILRQKKFRYYRGEMTKDELKENNWDQWQGTRPLKNEMDEWLSGDSDLNKVKIKLEYLKIMIESLESILQQIKARDWQIKNSLAAKVFLAGG